MRRSTFPSVLYPAVAALAFQGSLAIAQTPTPAPSSPAPTPSAPTPPPERLQTQTPVTPAGMRSIRTTTEDFTHGATINAPPDKVWGAVADVYGALKIPIDTRVDAERRLGAQAHRFRDRFAGERLSKSVTCGTASDGRDAADSYEVFLDIFTTIVPAQTGTGVYTTVSGVAKPVFTSGDPVRCASLGRLEERIAQALRVRAGS